MRVKKEKIDLAYQATKCFFEERAQRYHEANPYGATMYQDHNSELAEKRNEMEVKKILPLLKIDHNSVVLDIACGVGRWADVFKGLGIKRYVGTDFSSSFIKIARQRIQQPNFDFIAADACDTVKKLSGGGIDGCGIFNRMILSGVLLYLNDKDVQRLFGDIHQLCAGHTRIYIRVPIGMEERLTLKDFYSDELETEYNAIYRTKTEYHKFMEDSLIQNGFRIESEGYIFEDDSLNNRQETRQYYFILTNDF